MKPKNKILILGGGFGGVYTARHLEDLLADMDEWENTEVTLVSRFNFFLMTPLLFEAGSGVLEPRHSVSPIRALFKRARFVNGQIERVDFEQRVVYARNSPNEMYELPYDQLVIALGGVTNKALIPGSEHAMTFKTLADAIFLRNQVIDLFERADIEKEADRKRPLLTFVIVGAGLVGVELVGEMTEFTRNLAKSYPHIDYEKDVHFELIEAGPKIMPEMDRSL